LMEAVHAEHSVKCWHYAKINGLEGRDREGGKRSE